MQLELTSGLIPAHAGKTLDKEAAPAPFTGSSPLTRGKPGALPPRSLGGGLIPAHAGKTMRPQTSSPSAAAHPRSRGENFDVGVVATRVQRLIPAHAGKTKFPASSLVALGAHPRSRGENVHLPGSARARRGSSPLTRGKRSELVGPQAVPGLIPAHAGKTWG